MVQLDSVNKELRRLNRTLRVLSECNQTLIHAEDESAFLREVCRIIVEVGGYRMAWVGYAEQDAAKKVRPVAHAGFEEGYLSRAEITWADDVRGRGPTGTAIRTGRPTVNRNTETDPTVTAWREELLKHGYACSIGLPFQAGSRFLGALTLYASEPEAFDDEEIKLLSELAADVGFGIDTLRTRAERQRAAEALQDLYNNAPCGYHSLDKDGLFLRMNDTELRWLGYAREEVIGKLHIADILTENSRQVFAENFPRFKETGLARDLEFELVRRDGTAFPVMITASLLRDEAGNYVMSRSTVYDMTERKNAQRALAAERQRLFDVLDTLPAMICLLTPDYHVAFANRSFREKFGEPQGRKCHECCFGRSAPCEFCESYKVLETGNLHHWEVTAADGSIIDAHDFPFTDVDGSPMILEMDIDITQRKRAEEALRQLSARLLRTQDDERRRIARELHDSIGQELAALDLNLGWIKQSAGSVDARTLEVLNESFEIVKRCTREIRDFSYLLHPPMLDEYGLASALRWYTDGYARRTGIQVTLDVSNDLPRQSRDVETALFRVVQECLTNVHRHSGSSTASIRIAREANCLRLEVADQGRGLPAVTPEDAASRPGTGIAGMRERMRELGGTLEITSDSHGTTVRGVLPLQEEKAA
jgi:PAS domain S-box-containing protein